MVLVLVLVELVLVELVLVLKLAITWKLRVVEENCKLGFLNRRFGVPHFPSVPHFPLICHHFPSFTLIYVG